MNRHIVVASGVFVAACASTQSKEWPLPQPSLLADGGAEIVLSDNGRVPIVADWEECAADAGEFMRLLGQNSCVRDVDCKVYIHGIDHDVLSRCYAVRREVVGSQAFVREHNRLIEECGHVTRMSTQPCRIAVCNSGRCELQ